MYLGEDNQYYTEAQIAEQRAVTNHSSMSREQNSIYDQFNLQSRLTTGVRLNTSVESSIYNTSR